MKPMASPSPNLGGLKGPREPGQRVSAGRKTERVASPGSPRENHLPRRRTLSNGSLAPDIKTQVEDDG